MIDIYGTHVQNHNISRRFFFYIKTLVLQVVKRLKGQKMAQNIENFRLMHLIFQEPYIM